MSTIKPYLYTNGSYVPVATYENKTAAEGGTDESLVTTGEKYTWNSYGSTINTLSDKIDSMNTTVASLSSKVDSMNTTITSLNSKIDDVLLYSKIAASSNITYQNGNTYTWDVGTTGPWSYTSPDITVTKGESTTFNNEFFSKTYQVNCNGQFRLDMPGFDITWATFESTYSFSYGYWSWMGVKIKINDEEEIPVINFNPQNPSHSDEGWISVPATVSAASYIINGLKTGDLLTISIQGNGVCGHADGYKPDFARVTMDSSIDLTLHYDLALPTETPFIEQ